MLQFFFAFQKWSLFMRYSQNRCYSITNVWLLSCEIQLCLDINTIFKPNKKPSPGSNKLSKIWGNSGSLSYDWTQSNRDCYLYIMKLYNMLALVGQTAGPNWLTFFKDTIEYPGDNRRTFFFILNSKFFSTANAGGHFS